MDDRLSGSGKSTLANALEQILNNMGKHTYILDGDNLRHGLNSDLGFSVADRNENVTRAAETAQFMADAYPRFGPTSLWDMAAGHAFLKETGGEIFTLDQQPLVYNIAKLNNPDLIMVRDKNSKFNVEEKHES